MKKLNYLMDQDYFQDYFEYVLKKHGAKTVVNPSIRIYINKIEK